MGTVYGDKFHWQYHNKLKSFSYKIRCYLNLFSHRPSYSGSAYISELHVINETNRSCIWPDLVLPFCILFSFSIYPPSSLCIILLSSDVSTRALRHCYSRTFKFAEVWQEIWHFLSLARFSFYSLCVASRLLLLSLLLLLLPFSHI